MLQLRAMPVVFNTFAGWTTKNPIHIKRLWPVENPSGPLGLEFRYSVSRWPWIKKKKRTVKAQYPRLQCNDCRRETLQTSERNPRPRFGNLKTRRRARRQPNIPLAGPLSTMWPLSVNYHCVHDARRSPANRRGRPQRRGVQGDRFFVIRLPTRQEPPFRFRALQLWSS